ncbi:MAG: hypothetical protein ACOYNS_13090 [Bacteroidota bacterium]
MKNFLFILFIGSIVLLSNCKDTTTETVSKIDDIVFPASKVSYNRTIQPLFNIGCAVSDCHDVKAKASNLDLSDYIGLKQRFFDVVLVKDTVKSRLIWYIDGRLISSQWHRPLNSNQVKGFKTWIMEGATDTIR